MKFIVVLILLSISLSAKTNKGKNMKNNEIILPKPCFDSETSIEKALFNRRSVRNFKNDQLTLNEISQLLWASQGITNKNYGFRTAPSAGALYPLEVYLVSGNVKHLSTGVYKYIPGKHKLLKIVDGDKRKELYEKSLKQYPIKTAPATIVVFAVYERTTAKYSERGRRYVHMEAGIVSQNIYLQAESLKLGTVIIGAFDDDGINKVLKTDHDEKPLCIMPLGRK